MEGVGSDSVTARVTRLAPSPTGSLHVGNVRTFLVNWALARRHGWRIVLRMEDLDRDRVKEGAADEICETLTWLGMDWDEGPIFQSDDAPSHRDAMDRLAALSAVYPLAMSRREIEEHVAELAGSAPQEGSRESAFPSSLRPEIRARTFDPDDVNWRLVVEPGEVCFEDLLHGTCAYDVHAQAGDFVVWTMRKHASYQLAVVVDDSRQHVTDVVRGDDLLDSTARQILLAERLGLRFGGHGLPRYCHLPLVLGEDGNRLAKRAGDAEIEALRRGGASADRIVGLCACWSGVCSEGERLDAAGLVERIDVDKIPRRAVKFTREDARWLVDG